MIEGKPVGVSAYLSPDLVAWLDGEAMASTRTRSQMVAHYLGECRRRSQGEFVHISDIVKPIVEHARGNRSK